MLTIKIFIVQTFFRQQNMYWFRVTLKQQSKTRFATLNLQDWFIHYQLAKRVFKLHFFFSFPGSDFYFQSKYYFFMSFEVFSCLFKAFSSLFKSFQFIIKSYQVIIKSLSSLRSTLVSQKSFYLVYIKSYQVLSSLIKSFQVLSSHYPVS